MVEKGYIDRELAFDMITDLAGMATTKAAYAAIWKSAKQLNEVPTADVAPVKHGHWVSEYDCGYTTPHCSECGETALTKEETSYDYVYSSYCPHCGAKMDGGDNE